MDAFEILVIILSSFLALALLLFIIVLVYVIKVVKSLKLITQKAATLVDNASNVAATFKKAAGPAVVAKFVAQQISKAVNTHDKRK